MVRVLPGVRAGLAPAPVAAAPRPAIAWTGLAVAGFTVVLAGLPLPGYPRLLAVLAFACLGPGAAVLCHLRARIEPAVAWSMVLLVSVSAYAGGSAIMVWTRFWEPRWFTVGLAVLAAGSCLVALARSPHRVGPLRRPSAPTRRSWVDAGVIAVAVAAWLSALWGTDVTAVGQFGLLATVHPGYVVALALCCAGFAAELRSGARRTPALVAYIVLLIALLHATTPLLLAEPEYAWTFKHLGVVELFAQQGQIANPRDIYQAWPAFFTAVAAVSGTAGVPALDIAAWSPVFFNLIGSVVLWALAATLSANRRVAYLTVFLFQCVNWVSGDYLSPQALGFFLSLGVMLVLVRWLRREPEGGRGRLRARLYAGLPQVPKVTRRERVGAIAVLVPAVAVLTASHQLSPYLVAASGIGLVVLRLVGPWWVGPLLLLIPVAYLIPRLGLVESSFSIFDSLDIFGNASGNAGAWGSTGQAFSATVVRLLAIGVWVATAVAVYRSRRRLGRVLIPATLAVAPFSLLFAQSYGGEAIYRVFLFSAPWCAYLIADLAVGGAVGRAARPAAQRLGRIALAATVLLALALGAIQGRHGQLVVDRQTAAEVEAAEFLYAYAQPGSTVALVAPNFPSRLAANYGEFNAGVPVGEPDLVEGAGMRDVRLGAAWLPAIESFVESFGGTGEYLVVSRGMRAYADYFGLLPRGSIDTLERALDSAPQWSVFYRNQDVVIYRLDRD